MSSTYEYMTRRALYTRPSPKGSFRCVGKDTEGRPVLLFAARLNNRSTEPQRVVANVVRMIVCVLEEAIAGLPGGGAVQVDPRLTPGFGS